MSQTVEVRTTAGALVDPDTIVISIVDPKGAVKVTAQGMTKDVTGEYSYDYLIAVDAEIGKWKTEIKAVKGFTQIEQDEFTVMEAI